VFTFWPAAFFKPMVKPGPTNPDSFGAVDASARPPNTSPTIAAVPSATRIDIRSPWSRCVPQEYDRTSRPDWPEALPDGEVEPLAGLVVGRDVAEQDVVAG